MAGLFGNEQEKTGTAAEIENFLRTGPVELQLPDARDVSFQPALGVGVLGIVGSGSGVARLNIAQPVLIDFAQELAGLE